MDPRRLKVLAEFAAHGTVTATARALHLTGPAVSQQLAALEKETGVRLLEKRGRTLHLTTAGRRLVDHAHVVLGDLAAAESDLAAMRRGERATVRIAAFPSAGRTLVPRLWPAPGESADLFAPHIHLVEYEPCDAERALLQQRVDIALTHAYSLLPRPLPGGCEQLALLDDPVYLVLHAKEAATRGLAPGTAADLSGFADAPWLLPGPESACREMVQRACGAAGFVPRPLAVATDFTVLTALAARGAGVALIPGLALPQSTADLSVHPLEASVKRTVQALYRRGTSRHPGIRDTLDRLRSVAEALVATTS